MYTTKTLQRISVRSAAKVFAGLHGAIGLIFGIIFSLFALVGGVAANESGSAVVGIIFGVGAIVFMPLFYGIIGFFSGGVFAFIYNKTVKWTGGLRVDVTGGVMDEDRPKSDEE